MTAIDLPLVRTRAAEIAALFPDVRAVLAAAHSMLGDYADLTHRPTRTVEAVTQTAPRTPMPVVRAIISALRQPVQDVPLAGLDLVKGLWAAGSREERRLAAELLGRLVPEIPAEAYALIETWLPQMDDAETADAVAEHAFAPLLLAEPGRHLQTIRRWMNYPHSSTRRCGLAALGVLARDKKWDDVPGALDILRAAMTEADMEVRRAAAAALGDLIPKSPMEVRRFLHEQALRPNNNTHWIIRTAMAKLPAEEQEELVKVMRL